MIVVHVYAGLGWCLPKSKSGIRWSKPVYHETCPKVNRIASFKGNFIQNEAAFKTSFWWCGDNHCPLTVDHPWRYPVRQ